MIIQTSCFFLSISNSYGLGFGYGGLWGGYGWGGYGWYGR